MIVQPTHKRVFWLSTSTVLSLCLLLLFMTSRTAFASSTSSGTSTSHRLPLITQLGQIRGIQGDQTTPYPLIPWLRLAYASCGSGNLTGGLLQNTIQHYHDQGIHILLTVCQPSNTVKNLYDPTPLVDAAQGGADAIQCGNEEMKQAANVSFLYIPPDKFARWYDLCEGAMHNVQSGIPVLVGSLDPHVGGIDYYPLLDQVHYLDAMQTAMNTQVHPGGQWDWHTQSVGLIDSWHNGYPTAKSNSLYGLFVFWAQQFNVNLNSGGLGQHLWVVEGTGCFIGCGIDASSPAQIAISHIITLITDVLTAKQYNVPFFFFTGKDFLSVGIKWPLGVLNLDGSNKPLRQDLPMGARRLNLSCVDSAGNVTNAQVQTQERLLAELYADCTLPSNYVAILES